jgi:RNA polymerase sigma factor (sigma-70 family)
MDRILLPFLQSTDAFEREELLSDLILVHAAPLVRTVLRQRLGFSVNHNGRNAHNQDAEDIYHDVVARIIQHLCEPRIRRELDEIENFRHYVSRVAANACYDYLRAKSPARARLKNNLRDLLKRHSDFDVWKSGDETLCGFRLWHGSRTPASAARRLIELQQHPERFLSNNSSNQDINRIPLTKLVADLFNWIEGPIEIEALVNVLSDLLKIKDYPVESLDADEKSLWKGSLTDTDFRCASSREAQELLGRLWDTVRRLPEKQRDTFCFSFADESGDDLFTLLLEARIVSFSQIAEHLGRSMQEIIRLWRSMPMDNAQVAGELNATRQQINKWRFRALRKLEEELLMVETCK